MPCPSTCCWLILVLLTITTSTITAIHAQLLSDDTLLRVYAMWRHGDRTPISTFPTMTQTYPQGLGQLTLQGMQRHYTLGTTLRDRFITNTPFLNQTYQQRELFVMASDVDRTLQSAQANLAGLYQIQQQVGPTTGQWSPVPIHTAPMHPDTIIRGFTAEFCPRYQQILDDRTHDPRVRQLYTKHTQLVQRLPALTGKPADDFTFESIIYTQDPLIVLKQQGLPLPNGFTDQDLNDLTEFVSLEAQSKTWTVEGSRLGIGVFFGDLQDRIRQAVEDPAGAEPTKMMIYSAHDATLVMVLGALGLYDGSMPPYAATILFELHKVPTNGGGGGSSLYVRVTYQNEPLEVCPGFGHACPLNEFYNVLAPIAIRYQDFAQACAPRNVKQGGNAEKTKGLTIGFSFTISLLLLAVIVKRRQIRKDEMRLRDMNGGDDHGGRSYEQGNATYRPPQLDV